MDVKCKITLDNLFIKYGREPFLRWVKSLSIFRFCKAYPYPKDMKSDHFLAVIKYSNEKDYENILLKMNLDIASSKSRNAHFRKYTEFSFAGWQFLNCILCYMDVNKINHTIV